MPELEPDPGFTVVDRRRRSEDEPPPRESLPLRGAPAMPVSEPTGLTGEHARADLASLCVMIYSDGLAHLGQVPDPVTGQPHLDLEQARFAVGLLEMVKEKTEGNRTTEESAILDEILTTLRMGFVRASRVR